MVELTLLKCSGFSPQPREGFPGWVLLSAALSGQPPVPPAVLSSSQDLSWPFPFPAQAPRVLQSLQHSCLLRALLLPWLSLAAPWFSPTPLMCCISCSVVCKHKREHPSVCWCCRVLGAAQVLPEGLFWSEAQLGNAHQCLGSGSPRAITYCTSGNVLSSADGTAQI